MDFTWFLLERIVYIAVKVPITIYYQVTSTQGYVMNINRRNHTRKDPQGGSRGIPKGYVIDKCLYFLYKFIINKHVSMHDFYFKL